MSVLAESMRNALVGVLSFLFGIIVICVLAYLLYKFVLLRIDWIKVVADMIKGALK